MSITLGTENLHLILNYIKQFMKAMFAAGYQPRPSPEQLSLIMHHASNTHWPCVKKFRVNVALLDSTQVKTQPEPVGRLISEEIVSITSSVEIYSAAIQLCSVG